MTEPCLTEPCIHAASEILRSIDQNVDPCDDFYGFSCNKWIKNNPIPDGKSMWGTFGKLEQRNQLVVKNVLGKYSIILFHFHVYLTSIVPHSVCVVVDFCLPAEEL